MLQYTRSQLQGRNESLGKRSANSSTFLPAVHKTAPMDKGQVDLATAIDEGSGVYALTVYLARGYMSSHPPMLNFNPIKSVPLQLSCFFEPPSSLS